MNTISKICFKHKNIYEMKYLWHYILYYITGKGSLKNRLIRVTKQRKFGLKKNGLVFLRKHFWQYYNINVYIWCSRRYNIAYFVLVLSHLFIKNISVMQYKIIENCLKAIKDTISKNRIINLEYIFCQQNKVNIRILISRILKEADLGFYCGKTTIA